MIDMRRGIIAVLAVLAAGCAAHRSTPDPKPGGLKLTVIQLSTEGTPQIRVEVRNTYEQPVDGVRLIASFYKDDPNDVVGSVQRTFGVHLAPGESSNVALEVERRYLSRNAQARFTLRAAPETLGGSAIDPPQGWTE